MFAERSLPRFCALVTRQSGRRVARIPARTVRSLISKERPPVSKNNPSESQRLMDLYRNYQEGRVSRRDFMRGAAVLGAGALAAPAVLSTLGSVSTEAAQASTAANGGIPLDLAEWSYFWVGVERLHHPAAGTMVSGRQMYVEYFTPAQVKHPYTVVLVHGGGGQGTDWMGTPGRPSGLGHVSSRGRLQGGGRRSARSRTLAAASDSPRRIPRSGGNAPGILRTVYAADGRCSGPNRVPQSAQPVAGHRRDRVDGPQSVRRVAGRKLGAGAASSPGAAAGWRARTLPAGAPGCWRRGGCWPGAAPPPLDGGVGGGNEIYHMVWRQDGAEMLDKLGPSIIVTHSAGGPFGWIVAEARPNLVKGIIAIEGAGAPFQGQNIWGLSDVPVAYDPPVSDPAQIKPSASRPKKMSRASTRTTCRKSRHDKLKNLSEHSGRARHVGRLVRVTRQSAAPPRTSSRPASRPKSCAW